MSYLIMGVAAIWTVGLTVAVVLYLYDCMLVNCEYKSSRVVALIVMWPYYLFRG